MALAPLHRRRHFHPLTPQPQRRLLQPHLPNNNNNNNNRPRTQARPQTHRLQRLAPETAEQDNGGAGGDAPEHRSQTVRVPAEQPGRAAAVPGHKRGALLHRRHGRLFLGFQRRRGGHGRAVDAAQATEEPWPFARVTEEGEGGAAIICIFFHGFFWAGRGRECFAWYSDDAA